MLLVKKGLAQSREKAKLVIMAGDVFVNGQREDKAGTLFDEEKSKIEVRGAVMPYVGRGGLKLEKALAVFPIRIDGMVCMDIGASTGGFTDCMLQNGAAKVYAVDVGHGQLAWKLRSDERVVCMEKTNFRYMVRADIDDDLDFAACDVSFISLTKILGPAWQLLKSQAFMVCLIKPQFEAGREQVGKKGVVRDEAVHKEVIIRVLSFAKSVGFAVRGLDYSPIKGPEGNIEYLAFLQKCGEPVPDVWNFGAVSGTAGYDGQALKNEAQESAGNISAAQDGQTLACAAEDVVRRAHDELDGKQA